jgi:hypothetical protein
MQAIGDSIDFRQKEEHALGVQFRPSSFVLWNKMIRGP